jgi:hypothetical protein
MSEGNNDNEKVIGEVTVNHSGASYLVPYQANVDQEGDVTNMNYDLPKDLLEALAMPITELIQTKILEDMQKWKKRY